MSLIPSKRVDRIFPIIPPLCLLLAAQFAAAESREGFASRARQWCAFAIILAGLFGAAYSAQKIVSGYRDRDDALVKFAAQVRATASRQGWRYEAVRGRDEGMLLYLRRLHFINVDGALAEWNSGRIDALVAPDEQLPRLLAELPSAQVRFQSALRNDARSSYSLLVR